MFDSYPARVTVIRRGGEGGGGGGGGRRVHKMGKSALKVRVKGRRAMSCPKFKGGGAMRCPRFKS